MYAVNFNVCQSFIILVTTANIEPVRHRGESQTHNSNRRVPDNVLLEIFDLCQMNWEHLRLYGNGTNWCMYVEDGDK
jgi:hypothetical protein